MDVNLTNTLISIATGLIGVLAGATISWYASERRFRVQNTVDLQREWNGEGMAIVRMRADRMIRNHPGKDLLQLEMQDSPENYSNILRILTFFQRMRMLVQYRQINTHLVPELFGRDIVWWHVNCFRDRLPESWIMRSDWLALHAWIQKHSPADTYARWVKAAEHARLNRENVTPAPMTQELDQHPKA